ncbi:MAG: glycosyltransferase family 2 protein, partial [Acidobacteriota bacterium]
MSEERIDISVIIACRNEAAHIGALLESLRECVKVAGKTVEVLIADGMSDDGTREALTHFQPGFPRLTVLPNPGRIVSTGLNAAIKAARGKVILRMDAHTNYAPDYIQRCVETLESTGADNVGGPARTQAQTFWGKVIATAYHSRFACGGARFHDGDYEGYVDTVPYGCWHRETFDKIGLFDEALVRNQDDEFNLRLTRAGGKIWQSSAIRSWYSPRAAIGPLFRQYFQYGFWKVAVVRKHRLPASWRHLIPAGFVAANISLLGFSSLAALLDWHSSAAFFFLSWLAMITVYLAAAVFFAFVSAGKQWWM